MFAAVAEDYTTSQVIMTSTNGIDWTAHDSPYKQFWQSICWSPELAKFVAVGYGPGDKILSSTDGITWVVENSPDAQGWYAVCWSSELYMFVAGATGYIMGTK
jgi:hypothetical protein